MNAKMPDGEIDASCSACGGGDLLPHMSVAGGLGEVGLIPTTDQFGTALADIVRCERCGHMQLERMPAGVVLEEGYAEAESTDYVEEEAGQRATAAAILAEIECHVPVSGGPALLDLGCWVGFLLDEARSRGWRTTGIEPSAFASAHARERFGLDIRTETIEAARFPPNSFDACFMGDVIEHLPDPGAALGRIRVWLEPGGVVALAIPNAGSRLARVMGPRWWAIVPTHVQYFTRRSIGTLLTREGYQVLHIGTQPKTFSVAYYLGRLAGYSPALGRGLVGAARAVGLAGRPFSPDFGDRMLVIARKAP